MKIMQIIPTLELAGAEVMCENLTCELAGDNEVTVVSMYDRKTPISERLKQKGIKVIFLDKKPGPDFSMVKKLRKVIRDFKPEVIHTHLDCVKYAYPAGSKEGVKKFIHTVHNIASKESSGIAAMINKRLFTKKGVVPVGLSPEVKETICRQYGLLEDKVPVIYNGIDLDKCICKSHYESENILEFIHVGRFSEQKNHRMLINAFAKFVSGYRDAKLTLVGEGALQSEIKDLVKEKGIEDKVFFNGPTDNVFPLLERADVFVLPSLYEGVPMSLIEAMGTGLPIIATNVGGIPDMLNNSGEALIIDKDEEALVKALNRMTDISLREILGQNALERARKDFSVKKMAEEYMKLYKN